MRTIAADEIERRGLSVVDKQLKHGPVHILRDGAPRYVIIDEAFYHEMVEDLREAEVLRIAASLEDVKAGRVRHVTAEELARMLDIEAEFSAISTVSEADA